MTKVTPRKFRDESQKFSDECFSNGFLQHFQPTDEAKATKASYILMKSSEPENFCLLQLYVHLFVHLYACLCVHMSVYMHACMHVSMRTCVPFNKPSSKAAMCLGLQK